MGRAAVIKKAARIAADVIVYLFVVICIISVILTIATKKDKDGTAVLFGYQMRFVKTASMEKCDITYDKIKEYDIKDIKKNSLLFIETVPEDDAEAFQWFSDLRIGDVLTFKYVYGLKQETITHRITAKEPTYDASGNITGYVIDLMGDNRNSDDGTLYQQIDTSTNDTAYNYIVGKVVAQNYFFGLVSSALKSVLGLILLIMVPCAVIIILEVIRVVNVINKSKKEEAENALRARQDEIDELKRKLSSLEDSKASKSPDLGAQNASAEGSDK